MRSDEEIIREYCTGCGLCHDILDCEIILKKNGFKEIETSRITKEQIDILKQLCPAFGHQCESMDENYIWGRRKSVHIAYAADKDVRHRASSGGVLTQLACYLLDKKIVDGVIHIGKDEKDPIGSKLFCSESDGDVISHCGSRYTSSSPFYGIKEHLNKNKKYCFIGKPCDIVVLRNWQRIDESIAESIPYALSFFCAGAPSRNINLKLLEKMGCSYDDCVDLDYRGNGWPGFTTASDKNGKQYQIKYREAWGQTLGRDIRKICRFCIDGIGEMADISCCDAWYLDENKKPSFEEHEGRNAVFCRTDKGEELLRQACEAGYLKEMDYPELENDLRYSQYHQYFKKGSMYSSIMAMKVMLKPYPKYNSKKMKHLSRNVSVSLRIKKFAGTIKRIIKGKIV